MPRCISHGRCAIVNRTQGLVLGFFLTVLGSLVAIRVAAPEVYGQALRLPPSWPRWTASAFLSALAAFIMVLSVGVLRRWRWTFWLILVAVLAEVLRVPPGAPIGVGGVDFEAVELDAPAGATLLLYTDGLSEARDETGRFYDPEVGLAGRANARREPTALLGVLATEVRRHSGGGMADDMALIAVRRP